MAERRDPGTPIGGERPTRRRIFSSLHEMDGMEGGAEHLQNEVPVPLTPPACFLYAVNLGINVCPAGQEVR